MRCPSTNGQYHNRTATRVTTKSYGLPIHRFTSAVQLLSAIRDAIAGTYVFSPLAMRTLKCNSGHQRLVGDDIRILHRDISHNNVLIGNDGAKEGSRGVLIDLDMACRALDPNSNVTTDHEIVSSEAEPFMYSY